MLRTGRRGVNPEGHPVQEIGRSVIRKPYKLKLKQFKENLLGKEISIFLHILRNFIHSFFGRYHLAGALGG